jgi:hypothetical protein
MKLKSTFSIFLIAGLLLVSCKKYPDGPALSFRSTTARVANTWKVTSYTINDIDYTTVLTSTDYTETYNKENEYSYNSTLGGGSGKWEFQSDDKEIKRSGVSGQSGVTLQILRLKEKEFWYYYLDGNDRHEIHLEEN